MPEIIDAGVEDIPLIKKLAYEIWPIVYDYMISAQQIDYMLEMMYSEDSLSNQLTRKNHCFAILKDKDVAVGFVSHSSTEDPDTFYLQKLYLHPQTQGKGYGALMLDYVINKSKAAAGKRLELNVNKTNHSVKFYEKHGFEIIRSVVNDIGGGFVMDDYVMGKDL